MKSERIQFKGSKGTSLDARLDTPDTGNPIAYAIYAHCFTCSKNYKSIVNIAKALVQRNIGVLRFDFTGLGESKGDFSETDFGTNIGDFRAAAAYLGDRHLPPKILIGHSFGGAAVLQAAGGISSAAAVVTVAAPFDPAHVSELLDLETAFKKQDEVKVTIAGRSYTLKKHFLEAIDNRNPAQTIAKLNKPLLIFHSPLDKVVDIDNAGKIFQAAKHPKSFISLDTADHLLSNEKDSRYVGFLIAEWASRYL